MKTFEELETERTMAQISHGKYLVFASIRNLVAELSTAAAGREGGPASQARARLITAQAATAELKQAALGGELVPIADIETTWSGEVRAIRARLLALPARIAGKVPHLTAAEVMAIDDEIRTCLTELSDPKRSGRTRGLRLSRDCFLFQLSVQKNYGVADHEISIVQFKAFTVLPKPNEPANRDSRQLPGPLLVVALDMLDMMSDDVDEFEWEAFTSPILPKITLALPSSRSPINCVVNHYACNEGMSERTRVLLIFLERRINDYL
jgi:terminase small subunit / prophage DNA-packing protein